ncbi:hypothetical protein N8T08_008075 [Aspergillus melleus]|uniref:Uncharacterized protein n=1 Tax=Aspergillus melleus TaxID=138277 RepID=A0ACC3AWV0_9EURO|nr:hypothetical protein N8T08_008075 [Aspergillus melleus]
MAIQLDGTIERQKLSDFEFFSGNSKGTIQGFGYEYVHHGEFGVRFARFNSVKNFALHGLTIVYSGLYYLVFETDIWIHDVEVTNGDECVTVKSPVDHLLIESGDLVI